MSKHAKAIYKWKNLTTEIIQELWIAREILSVEGRPPILSKVSNTGTKVTVTWNDYCKAIGSSRQVINRWLARWLSSDSLVGKLTGNPQFLHDERIGLAELGISEIQSYRWQREANLSEEDFEA
jgi:hypothetical protein